MFLLFDAYVPVIEFKTFHETLLLLEVCISYTNKTAI